MRKAIDLVVGSLILSAIFLVLSAWWVAVPAGSPWMTEGLRVNPPAASSTWIHDRDGRKLAELDRDGTLWCPEGHEMVCDHGEIPFGPHEPYPQCFHVLVVPVDPSTSAWKLLVREAELRESFRRGEPPE